LCVEKFVIVLPASNITSAITSNVNNYLLTATGTGTIDGESRLTFDGTTFTVFGNTQITGSTTITGSLNVTNNNGPGITMKTASIGRLTYAGDRSVDWTGRVLHRSGSQFIPVDVPACING